MWMLSSCLCVNIHLKPRGLSGPLRSSHLKRRARCTGSHSQGVWQSSFSMLKYPVDGLIRGHRESLSESRRNKGFNLQGICSKCIILHLRLPENISNACLNDGLMAVAVSFLALPSSLTIIPAQMDISALFTVRLWF